MPSHSHAPRLLVRLQKASWFPLSVEGSHTHGHQDWHESNNNPAAASDSASFTVRKHVAIVFAFTAKANCILYSWQMPSLMHTDPSGKVVHPDMTCSVCKEANMLCKHTCNANLHDKVQISCLQNL